MTHAFECDIRGFDSQRAWTFGETKSGPELHSRRSSSEQFYVLFGQVDIYDGREWVTAHPGDFCYFPEGGIPGIHGAEGACML